jgi:hypothetical protein
MITATAIVDDVPVTVTCDDRPNPLAPTPMISSTIAGIAVSINVQYRQINSISHTGTCTSRTAWKCTCAPTPADPAPLFAAAKAVMAQYWTNRNAADAARPYPIGDQLLTMIENQYCCPSKATGGPCTCC